MIKKCFAFLFLVLLSACYGVSYPKENIVESLENLVKKECGAESSASIVGKTLYLDIPLKGLISQNQDEYRDTFKKIQASVMSVTRVVLSSDAEIKYMAVTAFSPEKSVSFIVLQNIDDIKGYMYMRISREDYESRSLFEIEGPEATIKALEDKHDISDEEYVGRMIVAQINMTARSNPFIGAVLSNTGLKYYDAKDGILFISSTPISDERARDILRDMVDKETKKYIEKYNADFKAVRVIGQNEEILFEADLFDNAGK